MSPSRERSADQYVTVKFYRAADSRSRLPEAACTMKYFLRTRVPHAQDVLLMESGSPEVARRAMERISKLFPDARYHLCTCHAESHSSFFSSIFRAADYPSTWKKLGLLFSFWHRGWEILVILCTGEPILWRWKILALFLLRSKVIIVNENADFFWLDWANRRILRRFLAGRWGINRTETFQTLLRLLVFPLTLLFLLATVGLLYFRRGCRLLLWKFQGVPAPNPPDGTARR